MHHFKFLRTQRSLALVGVVVALGLATWWWGNSVLAWYYVQRLSRADEANRECWAKRVARLDEAAVPRLLACLRDQDSQVCGNAQAGLACLAACRQAEPARYLDLANRLTDLFPQLSLAGQCSVLELQAAWLKEWQQPIPAELRQAALRLLPTAGRSADKEVRGRALLLAGTLLQQEKEGETCTVCREVVRRGLQDNEAANRALATHLAAKPGLNLLPQVAPLLDDPAPAVRQAAMLAVGPYPEAVATDDLLRSLHDTDEDVRLLCEAALRSRGLKKEDVDLARLISDDQPSVRLQVLETLLRSADLEPGVWLRRLSHDAAPAVRAAAVRLASEHGQLDFADRLGQMAQNDPSPTVRQLAGYYLARQKKRQLPQDDTPRGQE